MPASRAVRVYISGGNMGGRGVSAEINGRVYTKAQLRALLAPHVSVSERVPTSQDIDYIVCPPNVRDAGEQARRLNVPILTWVQFVRKMGRANIPSELLPNVTRKPANPDRGTATVSPKRRPPTTTARAGSARTEPKRAERLPPRDDRDVLDARDAPRARGERETDHRRPRNDREDRYARQDRGPRRERATQRDDGYGRGEGRGGGGSEARGGGRPAHDHRTGRRADRASRDDYSAGRDQDESFVSLDASISLDSRDDDTRDRSRRRSRSLPSRDDKRRDRDRVRRSGGHDRDRVARPRSLSRSYVPDARHDGRGRRDPSPFDRSDSRSLDASVTDDSYRRPRTAAASAADDRGRGGGRPEKVRVELLGASKVGQQVDVGLYYMSTRRPRTGSMDSSEQGVLIDQTTQPLVADRYGRAGDVLTIQHEGRDEPRANRVVVMVHAARGPTLDALFAPKIFMGQVGGSGSGDVDIVINLNDETVYEQLRRSESAPQPLSFDRTRDSPLQRERYGFHRPYGAAPTTEPRTQTGYANGFAAPAPPRPAYNSGAFGTGAATGYGVGAPANNGYTGIGQTASAAGYGAGFVSRPPSAPSWSATSASAYHPGAAYPPSANNAGTGARSAAPANGYGGGGGGSGAGGGVGYPAHGQTAAGNTSMYGAYPRA